MRIADCPNHVAPAPDKGKSEGRRLEGIQVLRFFAAAFVVIAHAESRLARVLPNIADRTLIFSIGDIRHWGHWGVDLFFAISGFIMYWVTRGQFGVRGASREFLVKRAIRIVPVYWSLTGFAVVLLAVAPKLFSYRGKLALDWIVASFAFIPWRAPEGFVAPVLGLGWTLNYEVHFYLCFAVLLLFPERRALATITGFFIACAMLGTFIDLQSPWLRQATSWLLLEFLAGLWVARIYVSRMNARWIANVVGPIGVVVLLATIFHNPASDVATQIDQGQRLLLWGLPSSALLFWVVCWNWSPSASRLGRALVTLGDASYSIYLLQVFTLPGLGLALRVLHVDRFLPFDVGVGLLASGSIALGYAFFIFVERPMTQFAHRQVRFLSERIAM